MKMAQAVGVNTAGANQPWGRAFSHVMGFALSAFYYLGRREDALETQRAFLRNSPQSRSHRPSTPQSDAAVSVLVCLSILSPPVNPTEFISRCFHFSRSDFFICYGVIKFKKKSRFKNCKCPSPGSSSGPHSWGPLGFPLLAAVQSPSRGTGIPQYPQSGGGGTVNP